MAINTSNTVPINVTSELEDVRDVTVAINCILFPIGFCGNIWVIAAIIRMLFPSFRGEPQLGTTTQHPRSIRYPSPDQSPERERCPQQRQRRMMVSQPSVAQRTDRTRHLIAFVFAMSIADLLFMITLPLSISYLLLQEWVFGQFLCKMYWVVEKQNSLFSVVTLTLLSFERYMTICKPHHYAPLHTLKGATMIIGGAFVLSNILLIPLFVHAYTENHTRNGITRSICRERMPKQIAVIFTCLFFLISFCGPAILVPTFYARMMKKLSSHVNETFASMSGLTGSPNESRDRIARSRVPLGTVLRNVTLSIVFYYLCWTPYCGIMLTNFLSSYFKESFSPTSRQLIVKLSLLANSLPAFHAAGNWLFYALLNREIRRHMTEINICPAGEVSDRIVPYGTCDDDPGPTQCIATQQTGAMFLQQMNGSIRRTLLRRQTEEPRSSTSRGIFTRQVRVNEHSSILGTRVQQYHSVDVQPVAVRETVM